MGEEGGREKEEEREGEREREREREREICAVIHTGFSPISYSTT